MKILMAVFLYFFLSGALWAQDVTVVVSKATGEVKDVCRNCQYDMRFYDHFQQSSNPIPVGEDPKKYVRNADGTYAKRPLVELKKMFSDERVRDFKARIDAEASIPPSIKAFLKELADWNR